MLPRGARAECGMIGIQFVPGTLRQLQVEVGYSGIPGELYTNALAANLDEVRIGLPQEYASTVMESLVLRCQHRLPPGVLRIVDAAHGLVGSSPSVFDRLTTAAMELARLDATFMQDDDIARTLRSILIG